MALLRKIKDWLSRIYENTFLNEKQRGILLILIASIIVSFNTYYQITAKGSSSSSDSTIDTFFIMFGKLSLFYLELMLRRLRIPPLCITDIPFPFLLTPSFTTIDSLKGFFFMHFTCDFVCVI